MVVVVVVLVVVGAAVVVGWACAAGARCFAGPPQLAANMATSSHGTAPERRIGPGR
jgi:hypothetical protein